MSNKSPVKLREKQLKSGVTSLYLDLYWKGKRKYEFLNLYLVGDKKKDKETLLLANEILSKRVVEITRTGNGLEYFDKDMRSFLTLCVEKYPFLKNTLTGVKDSPIYAVDKNYMYYLYDEIDKRPIAHNSKWLYFSKLKAVLHDLQKKDLIKQFKCDCSFSLKETQRTYLTFDEIKQMVAVIDETKDRERAFVFSCLTGLRFSDVKRLKWGQVISFGNFTRIEFTQKKTNGVEYIDISSQAVKFMGDRGSDDECVFKLQEKSYTYLELKSWLDRAGINKHVSFHSARHSFAVMLLDLGTDIYTVSKLLGHRELSTTQVYAKILDKNKQAAVESIPDVFG